jgi:beta-galactosidase
MPRSAQLLLRRSRLSLCLCFAVGAGAIAPLCGQQPSATLPPGVEAVWNLDKAFHEATPTRERICLNGLWQWQPAEASSSSAPVGNWGYFKAPGCWPGISDYMQKDCQTVFFHPDWTNRNFRGLTAAWYRRDFRVPDNWANRRITVSIGDLNSYAVVYVDGKRAGEIHFPGGEIDITPACHPGVAQSLAMLVVAMPLKGVMLSYTDSASAREVKGSVARRGLCGDVYLTGTPSGPRLEDIRIETSVRRKECTFDAAIDGLASSETYSLRATVSQDGRNAKTFNSRAFLGHDLKEGRFAFTDNWMPDRLWDIDAPQNTCTLELSLVDATGRVLDTGWTVRFGFREFWIDGRDFYLNGTRIFLSAVPLDNAQVSAASATYDATRESLSRLKSFGINFVYTHNYGCEPGSHLGFEEILRAADDAGMLVAFSQPHFSHYDWVVPDADQNNGYARHAAYFVRAAQNHPSVVMYSMSHNATGYDEDMNPDLIDGIHDVRDKWALRNCALALRAEAIVRHLDPGHIVYHHASGNLGSMHAINFYPNFVPAQELSDWFGHWATKGVKPVFTCEYGAPFSWDWTMYRGWYKGQREWGTAAVPWEYCVAEWDAQFLGDRAFQISDAEKQNLRWEAQQFQAGNVWHHWDYPNEVGSPRLEDCSVVAASYTADNWRAFRTWGVSANSPWEFGHYWKLREGVDKSRRELKVDWEHLQRPGFSPDFIAQRFERMDMAFEASDWIPTPAGEALIRNNRPLLAWLGGKPAAFTGKDHNFYPGESVEKQLILINNSRRNVSCNCQWSFALPQTQSGRTNVVLAAGQQARIPLRFDLPATLKPGSYALNAAAEFTNGETQNDALSIDVLPPPTTAKVAAKIALFDPKGETSALMRKLGIPFQPVRADSDLSAFDIFIVGRSALSVATLAPDISRVRGGLKVLIFEQTSEVLEKRFGFRAEEYGLRQVFTRVADHPALIGIGAGNLCNWRGEATLTPPQLTYSTRPRYGPTVRWCDIPVTRAWRCGNRGNVASVLIEKPACGDFLPILDGGFSLQFSPLLEYREGNGAVLFCQMDVTGRTETDPAAELLARNLVKYVSDWTPPTRRGAAYAGPDAGRKHLESLGLSFDSYDGGNLAPDQVLILGSGVGRDFEGRTAPVGAWLKAGGHLLAVGFGQDDVSALLPFVVKMKQEEHIAAFFDPFIINTPFSGIGPADVHNRAPRQLPLVADGARVVGDGVLAQSQDGNIVFCQLEPWQFEGNQMNLKRTYRRTSFLLSRLLANMGVAGATPLLERFHHPVNDVQLEKRWLTGLYLDQPEEWDDPYRFFRW